MKYDYMDPPPPPKAHNGVYYGWFPIKDRNPSKVSLHMWNPETDAWEDTHNVWYLPSKAWGSWPEEDK